MKAVIFDVDHTLFTADKVLYDGVADLLTILQQLGIKVGALSSHDHRILVHLDEAGVRYFFDSVVCSAHVETPKAVDAVHRMLDELNSEPHNTILVSHAHSDILLGQEAGLAKTIGVSHGLHNATSLREAGADHIVHNIPGILDVIE